LTQCDGATQRQLYARAVHIYSGCYNQDKQKEQRYYTTPTILKACPLTGGIFYSQSAVDHTIPDIWP